MHKRRSLRQYLLTQFGETKEEESHLAESKGKTRKVIIQETIVAEARDGKDQQGPTLKELSTPSDYDDFTRISAPLNDNVNFKIDATMWNFLPIFHQRFNDEPYEFLQEFTQFC